MLAFAAGLIVMSYQSLWRGSSRTMFSVQEHRQLVNLCRSALSEANYKLQTQVEQGSSAWVDWCTLGPKATDRTVEPKFTRDYAKGMTNDPRFLDYQVTDVTLHRLEGLNLFSGMSGGTGTVDFKVTATVERHSPAHSAKLTLTERRAFGMSDATSPFGQNGRHLEFLATPVATFMSFE